MLFGSLCHRAEAEFVIRSFRLLSSLGIRHSSLSVSAPENLSCAPAALVTTAVFPCTAFLKAIQSARVLRNVFQLTHQGLASFEVSLCRLKDRPAVKRAPTLNSENSQPSTEIWLTKTSLN
jgi:hypothetical protein